MTVFCNNLATCKYRTIGRRCLANGKIFNTICPAANIKEDTNGLGTTQENTTRK